MEKDKIYFANEGLTSTSCNHVANMAKEYCQTLQKELDNISFVNGSIALVGGDYTSTKKGVTDISNLSEKLNKIAKCNSLIAWLREAIKAKDNLKKEVSRKELFIWCQDNNKEYPPLAQEEAPTTKDDVLATWTIKDRNRYLALGAKVSVYGKFLHPNGAYSEAREELKNRMNEPITYTESGRDTLIHKYSPSIDSDVVDDTFFKLQSEWRKAQAELNGYEHKIQLVIDKSTNEKNTKYSEQCDNYANILKSLNAEFKKWKDTTTQEIASLKVVIPNELKDIYDTIVSLSKK